MNLNDAKERKESAQFVHEQKKNKKVANSGSLRGL